ncbi:MAG: chromate transporter [Clostridia bacterium]|nr:chromate transporter [Clostridia bacterium]
MKKNRLLHSLFLTMLKIGLFTFGGGYAMIALLENELVNKRGWLTKDEFLNTVAIISSAPGSIAVNISVYIGYKLAGIMGSVCATLGVCLPSFVILYAISLFFDAFLSFTAVQYAFNGIRACVVYLILTAGIRMLKKMDKTVFSVVILGITVACMISFSLLAFKFSTVFYIIASGLLGLVAYAFSILKKRGEQGRQ